VKYPLISALQRIFIGHNFLNESSYRINFLTAPVNFFKLAIGARKIKIITFAPSSLLSDDQHIISGGGGGGGDGGGWL
jgi:hypothetical protein